MGITQARQPKKQLFEETLKTFDIIDKNVNYTLFLNKTTQQKLEFWKFTFNDEEIFKKQFKELTQQKQEQCSTLLQIVAINSVIQEEFCSTFYDIQILIEHPIQNFAEYLQNRGNQDYTSKELYHLIDCIAYSQIHLNIKQYLGFQNIYQGQDNLWKLRSFDNSYKPLELLKTNTINQAKHCYPAPEELINQECNQEKCTVFTFGMLLLHIALAKQCDNMYINNNQFDADKLNIRISELNKQYPFQLCDIMNGMLSVDPINRLTYNEIQNKLKEIQQFKVAEQIIIPQISNKYISNVKSPQETSRIINVPLFPIQEQVIINSQSIPPQSKAFNDQFISPKQSRIIDNKLTFADGRYYEGETLNEIMDGKGILYFSDGTIEYDGIFYQGQFHDVGILNNQYPDLMIDQENLPGNYWKTYEGEFQNGKKHGLGSMTFSNGDTYIGGFQNDQIYGRGTYTTRYGQTRLGFWDKGKLKQY